MGGDSRVAPRGRSDDVAAVTPARSRARRWTARLLARVDREPRTQWFAAFVPILALYLLTLRTDPWQMSADPTGVTPSAWGIAHHGTPIVAKSAWPFINPWSVPLGGGDVVSNRTPGLVYLATPFYWLFHGADTWDVVPGSLAAALLTAAAVATFGLLIRRLLGPADGPRVGLAAAYVGGLATTTWAVSGVQLFPHGPDQLLLVLAMLSVAGGYSARGGLAFGLAVLVRPPLALVAAVVGLWRSATVRRVRPALLIGLFTAAGAGGFLLYSHHYWNTIVDPGDPDATLSRGALNPTSMHSYRRLLTDWSLPALGDYAVKIAGALVSPGRGVLIGAPFLLLLVPGLRRAWRAAPSWARASAVGGVLYLLVQLKAEVFTGGQYFWSYRYPLETLTLCGPVLVLAWQEWTSLSRRRRAWFEATTAVAIGMQALGAICFHGPYPDRPWTFDNVGAALTGQLAVAGYALLVATVLGVLWALRRGYRTCATSPAASATTVLPVSTNSRPVASTSTAVPTTGPAPVTLTETDRPMVAHAPR